MNFRFIVILLIVFISGCSATGEQFISVEEPSEDKAVVYLFRDSSFIGSAYCPNVKVNGLYWGCLKMKGYFRIEIPSGKNKICFCKSTMEIGNNLVVTLDLKAGETRFFEWIPNAPNLTFVGPNVIPTGGDMESIKEHSVEESLELLTNYSKSR